MLLAACSSRPRSRRSARRSTRSSTRYPPERIREDKVEFRYELLNRSAACQEAVAHPRILEVDRAAARRGLPRHREHGVAQPARLRRRSVALRRGPAHPAPPRASRGTTASRIRCSRSARTSTSRTARSPTVRRRSCPGSHRSGRLAPFDRMYDPDLTYDGRPPVLIEASAGDVALFVSDVWHRGTARDRRGTRPLLHAGALRPPRPRAAIPHRPTR